MLHITKYFVTFLLLFLFEKKIFFANKILFKKTADFHKPTAQLIN